MEYGKLKKDDLIVELEKRDNEISKLVDEMKMVATIDTEKTLDNVDIEDVKNKVADVKVVGDGDTFQLICKASSKSQKWFKSTKAMEIAGVGVVIQVTTQQGDNIAEALTFVPNSRITKDSNGNKKITRN